MKKQFSDLDFQSGARIKNLPPPVANKDAISRAYWEACGVPHIINGFGGLGDNTNFPDFTFDQADLAAGFGSFKETTKAAYTVRFLPQLLAIDPALSLKLRLSLKAGNTNGTEFNAANQAYAFVRCYDSDGATIAYYHYARFPGATDTTLATALNPGDTTINLVNGTGWANGSVWHENQFAWYPYTNGQGYTYPDYTYTRNVSLGFAVGGILNPLWAAGGLSGNTITLRGPWTGPALAAGKAVRNIISGGTYLYAFSTGLIPNAWTAYEATMMGIAGPEEGPINKYRPGTAFIDFGFLLNYHGAGDTRYRVSAFSARYV